MSSAVGSLLELEEHDARWRCRTAQGRMRSLGRSRATNRTGHRTPGGREARHTRHTHSWGRHWTCPPECSR